MSHGGRRGIRMLKKRFKAVGLAAVVGVTKTYKIRFEWYGFQDQGIANGRYMIVHSALKSVDEIRRLVLAKTLDLLSRGEAERSRTTLLYHLDHVCELFDKKTDAASESALDSCKELMHMRSSKWFKQQEDDILRAASKKKKLYRKHQNQLLQFWGVELEVDSAKDTRPHLFQQVAARFMTQHILALRRRPESERVISIRAASAPGARRAAMLAAGAAQRASASAAQDAATLVRRTCSKMYSSMLLGGALDEQLQAAARTKGTTTSTTTSRLYPTADVLASRDALMSQGRGSFLSGHTPSQAAAAWTHTLNKEEGMQRAYRNHALAAAPALDTARSTSTSTSRSTHASRPPVGPSAEVLNSQLKAQIRMLMAKHFDYSLG